MDPMEAEATPTPTPTDTNPNPNTTQTPITQPLPPPLPPSSTTQSSIPSTPEFSTSSSSSSSMPTQNQQPQNPLQQQQPNFQQPQQRPPLGRTRPNQPHYHFTPHLPPSQIGSSSSSSSSSSSTFSSAPPPAVSAAPMQRGGLALGVPAHPTRPQQPAGSFSTFGSSPFNHQFGGLARNPINMQDQMGNPTTQGRQPMPGIQTIGMVGSLGSGSQLRPSGGISGHHPQRPGQPQLRTQAPSNNQSLANQKFQGPAMVRVQAMGSSGSSSQGTPQASQQHMQPWMKGQMNMSPLPRPANRPHMRPQTLQQRSQHPQQHHHHLPTSQHPHQIPSAQQHQQHHSPLQSQQQQEQHGQQYLPPRIQQPAPHQQQATRAPASAGQKSVVPTTGQPGTIQSGPIVPTGASTDAAESGNQILSKRTIHELVSQIDPSEKLDPSVEDALVEVAEDFIESITTIGCSLAKHRKSTTLEAKDILLHIERNWNMTLPGYSGDEIKCCKKPFMNDIHKERLAAIKKSMIGTDTGNTRSSAGQATGNPKAHATKAPGTG
ncbi:hypothetical protein AAC387_Pa12g0562 [Persea americana]